MSSIAVTKVDIKLTPMMVSRAEIRYFTLNNKDKDLLDSEKYIKFETEYWQVQKICLPDKTIKNYLVKVSDQKLFQELFLIANGLIDEKVNEKLAIRRENIKEAIKKLSWWKRLFNKF